MKKADPCQVGRDTGPNATQNLSQFIRQEHDGRRNSQWRAVPHDLPVMVTDNEDFYRVVLLFFRVLELQFGKCVVTPMSQGTVGCGRKIWVLSNALMVLLKLVQTPTKSKRTNLRE